MDYNEIIKQEVEQIVNERLLEIKTKLTKNIMEAIDATFNITQNYEKCNNTHCKNYANGKLTSFCKKCGSHISKEKESLNNEIYQKVKPILDVHGITLEDVKRAQIKLEDPAIRKNLEEMVIQLGLSLF